MTHRLTSHITSNILLITIIVVLIGIGVSLLNSASEYRKSDNERWAVGPADAMMSPLVLSNGFVWHPNGEESFVYQVFSSNRSVTHNQLPGVPVQWYIVPSTNTSTYHIAWLNDRDELWHTKLDANGGFEFRPVRLAEATVEEFTIVPLTNGGAVILWQVADRLQTPLYYILLDALGRARIPVMMINDVSLFDAAMDGDQLHLVWTTPLSTIVQHATYDIEALQQRALDVEVDIHRLALSDTTWLDDVFILSVDGQIETLYTTRQLQYPEQRELYLIRDHTAVPLLAGQIIWWVNKTNVPDHLLVTILDNARWRPARMALTGSEGAKLEVLGQPTGVAAPASVWIEDNRVVSFGWARINATGEIEYAIESARFDNTQKSVKTEYAPIFLIAGLWLIGPAIIMALRLGWSSNHQWLLALVTYWSMKAGLAFWWLPDDTINNALIMATIAVIAGVIVHFGRSLKRLYVLFDALLTLFWVLIA